jgi:putative transposase
LRRARLGSDADDPAFAALRRSESIGRPLGDDAFLQAISCRLNRALTPRKQGRKPKGNVAGAEVVRHRHTASP